MKTYVSEFDCGNDIVTVIHDAENLIEAKENAKKLKRSEFDNNPKIKVTTRLKK